MMVLLSCDVAGTVCRGRVSRDSMSRITRPWVLGAPPPPPSLVPDLGVKSQCVMSAPGLVMIAVLTGASLLSLLSLIISPEYLRK